jgi:V8-like Glu-specific endopeptidase
MECIVGGGAQEELLSMALAEENAVVRLESTTTIGTHTDFANCSGVLVASNWILTASHCIPDLEHTQTRVVFGAAEACGDAGAVVTNQFIAHEELDLSLLNVPLPQSGIVSPIAYGDDAGLAPGKVVELSGFGETDDGGSGRRFVIETVSRVDETSISVSGNGVSGACAGDSGGPLLTRDQYGKVQALGVLSRGSADCISADSYVRLSSVSEWLNQRMAL